MVTQGTTHLTLGLRIPYADNGQTPAHAFLPCMREPQTVQQPLQTLLALSTLHTYSDKDGIQSTANLKASLLKLDGGSQTVQ